MAETARDKDKRSAKTDQPLPPPADAPKPGLVYKLKSLYYTKSGGRKDFVSFSRMDVPMFMSIEGDQPVQPVPTSTGNEEEQEQDFSVLQKKTRKIVIAPSVLEFKTYRYMHTHVLP